MLCAHEKKISKNSHSIIFAVVKKMKFFYLTRNQVRYCAKIKIQKHLLKLLFRNN